jgi:predicted acylesterase/phospholipase RssA
MKPFRKNVAIAIDGGGIRGVIPARALMMLEESLGKTSHEIFRLSVGTSTGSILAAGVARGLSAEQMYRLYVDLGNEVFKRSLRSWAWFAVNFRYPRFPLEEALRKSLGDGDLGDLWKESPPTDLVVTTFDVIENRTRFMKPYKSEYAHWPLVKAVLASAAAPTYFPVVGGHFIDGGVGSYNNPCYMAAYELQYCLKWKLEETTLISLGTGRTPNSIKFGEAGKYLPIQWISRLLDAFSHSADDQQVHLVDTFFEKLDFRRFQVDLDTPIALDQPETIPELIKYGEKLGEKLLNDKVDRAQSVVPSRPPKGSLGRASTKSTSRRQTSKSDSQN